MANNYLSYFPARVFHSSHHIKSEVCAHKIMLQKYYDEGKENGYLEKYDVNNLKFENQILIEFIIVKLPLEKCRNIYIYAYIFAYNCKRFSFVLVAYTLYHLNFAEGL